MVDPRPEGPAGAGTTESSPLEPPETVAMQALGPPDQPGRHVRLFGTHAFFRLWLAQVVSAMGDWLGFLAITILAARVGGGESGSAVGLVMTARILPGFFLAPVAGVLIDRWDRTKVMVVCDVGRAVVIASLPFVDTVPGLVLASFILEIFTLFWSPAKEASVPNVVPAERLTSANSLSLAAAYGTFPVAAALFALLAKVSERLGGIEALDALKVNQEALAFYFDMLTFLLSALMISTLHLPKNRRAPVEGRGRRIAWTQTFSDIKEGWRFIFLTPVVRAVNIGLATGLIGGGMVVPLGSVYSIVVLGAGPAGYGVYITALGFGVGFGVLAVSVTQRRLPKSTAFSAALFAAGASLIASVSTSSLTTSAVLVGLLGMFAGAIYVLGFTLLHESVGDELRGRIFTALYTIVRLCLLIAFAVGPFLSDLLHNLSNRVFDDRRVEVFGLDLYLPGVRLTLWLAGGIIIVAGVLTARTLRAGGHET